MRRTLIIALLLATAAPLAARADSLFDLSATFSNGDTATGTLDLDTANNLVLGGTANLYTGSGSLFDSVPVFAGPPLQGIQRGRGSFDALIVYGSDNTFLQLDLPVLSLVGYTGSPIVLSARFSNLLIDGDSNPLTAGAFSLATAATPEPSSLLLLGTGAFGLLSAARRRRLV